MRVEQHTLQCSWFSVVKEATHEVGLRALEGQCVSSKSPSSVPDFDKLSCWMIREKTSSPTRSHYFLYKKLCYWPDAWQAYRQPPNGHIFVPRYYQLPLMYGSYEAVQPLDETSSSEDQSHHQVAQTFYQTHMSLIYACTVALAMAGISIFFFRKLVGLIRGVIYEQVSSL